MPKAIGLKLMPRVIEKHQKLAVKEGREIVLNDLNARGLFVRISPRGHASFLFYAKIRGTGKVFKYAFGVYPSMTLAQAREEARNFYNLCYEGEDPKILLRKKRERFQEPLFKELAEPYKTYLEKDRKLRPVTIREYLRQIERDFLPAFGTLRPNEATTDQIKKFLFRKKEKAPIMSKRLLGTIRSFFTFIRDHDLGNPPMIDFFIKVKERPRDAFLTDEQLKAFWNAKSLNRRLHDMYKLELLLGLRRGETAGLQWAYINWKKGIISLPSHTVKNSRPFLIPLTRQAKKIINRQPQLSPYVFGVSKKKPDSSGGRPFVKLRKELGFPISSHFLRKTFAEKLYEIGCPIVPVLLNHAPVGVTQIHYSKYDYLDEKKKWLIRLHSEIDKIVGDRQETKLSVVGA